MLRENEMKKKVLLITGTVIGVVCLMLGLLAIGYGMGQGDNSDSAKSSETSQKQSNTKPQKSTNSDSDNYQLVKIDKDSNVVSDTLKVHFIGVKYETVKNDTDNYTDAEYNMEGDPSQELNSKYYRATVYFTIENVGNKAVDSSTNERSIILDNGVSLDAFGHGHGTGSALEDRSTDTIQPKTKLNDAIIIVSNSKIQVDHPQIQFGRLYEPDADAPFADGGIAKI